MYSRLAAALILLSSCASAQQPSHLPFLTSSFKAKTVVFREPQEKKNLHYDATGELLEPGKSVPPPMYGVMKVEKVEIKGKNAVLKGRRLILFLDSASPKLHVLPGEELKVTIRDVAPLTEKMLSETLLRIFVPQDYTLLLEQYAEALRADISKGTFFEQEVPGFCTVYSMGKGSGVTIPKPIHIPDPEYPGVPQMKRVDGKSIWRVILNDSGLIQAALRKETHDADFDISSLEALRKWRFEPALKEMKPVCSVFNVEVNFKLH